MYTVVVNLQAVGKYSKFSDAFREFVDKVNAVSAGGIQVIVLETTNFITFDGIPDAAIAFRRLVQYGYDWGLLRDGDFNEHFVEPDVSLVVKAFWDERIAYFLESARAKSSMNNTRLCPHPERDRIVIQGGKHIGKEWCSRCEEFICRHEHSSAES